jgi:hypothetical protein
VTAFICIGEGAQHAPGDRQQHHALDGYYEGPGRNVMVLNMDEAFDTYNLERIRTAGTVLLGQTSFEGFSS